MKYNVHHKYITLASATIELVMADVHTRGPIDAEHYIKGIEAEYRRQFKRLLKEFDE